MGGAVGTLAALERDQLALRQAFARELDLEVTALHWHNQRDTLAEFGNLLAMLTGSLGKIGTDLLLMAQNEVAEITLPGGGSSAMAGKNNPILAEALVAAAQLSAGLQGSLLEALPHAHERGGVQLIVETATLPQILLLAMGAVRNAQAALDGMSVDVQRMRDNFPDGPHNTGAADAFIAAVLKELEANN